MQTTTKTQLEWLYQTKQTLKQNVSRDKEGHFRKRNWPIHQEYRTDKNIQVHLITEHQIYEAKTDRNKGREI